MSLRSILLGLLHAHLVIGELCGLLYIPLYFTNTYIIYILVHTRIYYVILICMDSLILTFIYYILYTVYSYTHTGVAICNCILSQQSTVKWYITYTNNIYYYNTIVYAYYMYMYMYIQCESQDPLTNLKDNKTLIRVSVVNGLDPTHVLLDALVQPGLPITDMKSDIHGITADMLTQAPVYTLRHAQAAILQLCTNSTVLVGQSLNNDLQALRLNHK